MINPLLVVALIASLFVSANGENWSVQVGKAPDADVYIPNNFDANVGDTVTFSFVAGLHDVNQADEFGKCAKSAKANAFTTTQNTGKAAAPPTAVWTLATEGPAFYFCSVADHCATGKMFAKINVLPAGAKLVVPGVKAAGPAPAPPAQPNAPADDQPNIPPSTAAPSSATPTSGGAASATPSQAAKSNASADKQISVAIIGGALLSFVGHFL